MSGTTNWSNVETWERVVASILATGVKIDLNEAAKYFGCTYHTLENRFRKLKKEAAVLKQEVESGGRGEVKGPARPKSNPTTARTPKKDALSTVANGRVSKASPSKKKSLKQEPMDSASSFDDEMHGSIEDAERVDENGMDDGMDEWN